MSFFFFFNSISVKRFSQSSLSPTCMMDSENHKLCYLYVYSHRYSFGFGCTESTLIIQYVNIVLAERKIQSHEQKRTVDQPKLKTTGWNCNFPSQIGRIRIGEESPSAPALLTLPLMWFGRRLNKSESICIKCDKKKPPCIQFQHVKSERNAFNIQLP